MAGKTQEKWLSAAIKNPGSLRRIAKAAGALDDEGNIKVSWLREKAKGNDKVAQKARLALTMRGWKK
jgi:hypothetical protein